MSHENVDTADAKSFLAQMSYHTLSEVKNTSSTNEAASKANTSSPPEIQCPHCKRPIALELLKNNISRGTRGDECGEKEGTNSSKLKGVDDIESDSSEQDLNFDSDSDADSFDLELEEKLFSFQQAQAVQHIEASEWAEAELLINRVLSNGQSPSFGGYSLTDWRIFLVVVQCAQDSFAAGLHTLKTIDSKEATLARLGFLLFTITLQYCKTSSGSNLKLAEKYCLKTIKTFRKAKDMGSVDLATDVMSHILRQKGDVYSSKFYLSLLPTGRESSFKDFSEVESLMLLPHKVLEEPEVYEPSVTNPRVRDLNVTQPDRPAALCSVGTPPFAAKLAKFNLAVKDGRLSGTPENIERAFKLIMDVDDIPFARFLLEDVKLLAGIDWISQTNLQGTPLNFLDATHLMVNIGTTHKTMAIPDIIKAGSRYQFSFMNAILNPAGSVNTQWVFNRKEGKS